MDALLVAFSSIMDTKEYPRVSAPTSAPLAGEKNKAGLLNSWGQMLGGGELSWCSWTPAEVFLIGAARPSNKRT